MAAQRPHARSSASRHAASTTISAGFVRSIASTSSSSVQRVGQVEGIAAGPRGAEMGDRVFGRVLAHDADRPPRAPTAGPVRRWRTGSRPGPDRRRSIAADRRSVRSCSDRPMPHRPGSRRSWPPTGPAAGRRVQHARRRSRACPGPIPTSAFAPFHNLAHRSPVSHRPARAGQAPVRRSRPPRRA